MANEYAVDQADLVSVADAIRAKGETAEALAFPDGFMSAIGAIQTGHELNFTVVGGMAEPENPTENTIWVSTDQAITSWVFSQNQPDSPSEGMVWIVNGESAVSEFDAVSDVSLRVQVSAAKQYVNDAWVTKTVKVYQSGSWISTFMYLFKSGYGTVSPMTSGKQTNATVTINQSYIDISYTDNSSGQASVHSTYPINLSGFSQLKAEILCTNNYNSTYQGRIGVYNQPIVSGNIANSSSVGILKIPTNSSRTVYSFSIDESMKGEFYIAVGGITKMKIYNLWLE